MAAGDDNEAPTDALYGPGASSAFLPGPVFDLTNSTDTDSGDYEAQAVVQRAFLPFTQCQVLLVAVCGMPSISAPVVSKIYDPRFASDRKAPSGSRRRPDMPWSLAVETEAAERRAHSPSLYRADNFERDPLAFEYDPLAVLYACTPQSSIERRLRPLQSGGGPQCFGPSSDLTAVLRTSPNLPTLPPRTPPAHTSPALSSNA